MPLFRILRGFRRDSVGPQLMVREIPASYLEADMQEFDLKDAILPAEVVYMLRSVRYECFCEY